MKKINKLIVFIIIILLFVLCLVPIPLHRNDGGTVEYSAILYRIIVWHKINPNASYLDHKIVDNGQPQYLTGTDFYIFPFNFGEKEYTKNLP